MKNRKDLIKELGKWGIIGYVLALPIMIWRSSKIGKIISICIIITFAIGVFGKIADVFFIKWRYRIVMDEEIINLQNEIKRFNKKIDEFTREVDELEYWISEKKRKYVKNLDALIDDTLEDITFNFREVNEALDLLKKKEQEALYSRMRKLKELINQKKKDIYNIKAKQIIEDFADDMFILSEEEREKIYQDLRNLKYKVEKIDEKSHEIYLAPRTIVTNDSDKTTKK